MQHILVVGGHEETFRMMSLLPLEISIFQKADATSAFQEEFAQEMQVFDYEDVSHALARALDLHQRQPITAVVSFTEYGLLPAAVICDKLGIRGTALEPVLLTRDKIRMRQHLLQHGMKFASVDFGECTTLEQVSDFFNRVGGPIVLKPAYGAGKVGVTLVQHAKDLENAFLHGKASHHGAILAEEYVDGIEYSVESMTMDGIHEVIAITEKDTHGSHFVEVGHRLPARLTAQKSHEIGAFIKEFLTVIGLNCGPAHTELRVSSSGIKIIESNTRPGGNFIWELLLHARGVNLVTETLCYLAELDMPERAEKAQVGITRLLNMENVIITKVTGADDVKASPGVVRFSHTLEPGLVIGPLHTNDDTQGVIVAIGSDHQHADACVEHALKKFIIETQHVGR